MLQVPSEFGEHFKGPEGAEGKYESIFDNLPDEYPPTTWAHTSGEKEIQEVYEVNKVVSLSCSVENLLHDDTLMVTEYIDPYWEDMHLLDD